MLLSKFLIIIILYSAMVIITIEKYVYNNYCTIYEIYNYTNGVNANHQLRTGESSS